jgi:heme a synthase
MPSTHQTVSTSRASVASWLGILLVALFSLNTLGGWVRTSGSGIAIPQWPLINGSLLPPFDEPGWREVQADWERHQQMLRQRVSAGVLSAGNLGRYPADTAEFRRMFLTEYSHRLFAALAGLFLAGCLTVIMRDRSLRSTVGWPMSGAGALVLAQAAIGGFLIDQGTNTHWLFLHQGNAAAIMALVLWSLLRLLESEKPSKAGRAAPMVRRFTAIALGCAWLQLVFGALVAGSKHSEPAITTFPTIAGMYVPALWEATRPLSWNLLDNAWLHQWIHRWFAWTLVAALIVAYAAAARSAHGPRLRLALQVSATFIGIQVILGITNVLVAESPFAVALPLAHQFMGMCLFCGLVLAAYDARNEPVSAHPRAGARDVRSDELAEAV